MKKSKKLKRKMNKNKISRKKHNPIQTSKRVKRVKMMRMKGGNALKIKVYNRLVDEIETKVKNYYFPRVSQQKESSNPIITGSNLEQVDEKELELLHMYIELLIIKHICLKEINNYDKQIDDEFIAKLNHLIIYKIDYLLGEIDKKMDNVFIREFIGQNDVYNIKKYIDSDFDNNVFTDSKFNDSKFNDSKQNDRVKTKIDKIKTEIEQKIQVFEKELTSGTNPEEIIVEMSDENDIVNPLLTRTNDKIPSQIPGPFKYTNITPLVNESVVNPINNYDYSEEEEKQQEPEIEEETVDQTQTREPEEEENQEPEEEKQEEPVDQPQEKIQVNPDYKMAMNKFTRKMPKKRIHFQNPKVGSLLLLSKSKNDLNQLTEQEQTQFMKEYKQLGFQDSITNGNQLLNNKKFIRLFNLAKANANMLPNVYNYNRQQTTRKRANI
jgi:hypothetical protein